MNALGPLEPVGRIAATRAPHATVQWLRRQAFILLPLLVLGFVAYTALDVSDVIRAGNDTGRLIQTSAETVHKAEELQAAVLDAGTDQQVYAHSRTAFTANGFDIARARIAAGIEAIDKSIATPREAGFLKAISRASHDRIARLDDQLDLNATDAERLADAEVGREKMRDLQMAIDGLKQSQARSLAHHREELARKQRITSVEVALASFGLLFLGWLFAASFVRTKALLAERTGEARIADKRFEALFDQAATGMAIVAPDGRWLRVNDCFCAISGFSRESLVGQGFSDITHPDDRADGDRHFADLLAGTTTSYVAERKYVRPSGEAVWANVSVSLILDEDGRPDFIVKVIQDISDWKAAQALLASGEAQYRAIFDSAVEAIAVIDEKGEVQSLNPAAKSLFGYEPDEVIGRNISLLMPSATGSKHDSYLADYKRTGIRKIIGFGREVEGLRKDGTTFFLALSVAEWEQEDKTYYTGIMRDITERILAEANLKESEAMLRLALASGGLGTWAIDTADGRILLDPISRDIFGIAPGAHPDLFQFAQLIHPDDRVRFAELQREIMAQVPSIDLEIRILLPDGSVRWVDCTGTLVHGEGGARLIGVVADVTETKEAAERLRRLQNEFADIARINDLSEMASAIAHEINQPITAISNYLSAALAASQNSAPSAVRSNSEDMMERAAKQAVRAGQIVRQLREFIGKNSAERQRRSADQLVDSAIAIATVDAVVKGITVVRIAGAGAACVSVDLAQFQQVVVNLVRNAIEALSNNAPGKERTLTIETEIAVAGGSVEFMVIDTGPGIDPALRTTLFDPFTTTKANGMGMGLSICKRLVEAHGGSIGFASPDVGGTAFHFSLPQDMIET